MIIGEGFCYSCDPGFESSKRAVFVSLFTSSLYSSYSVKKWNLSSVSFLFSSSSASFIRLIKMLSESLFCVFLQEVKIDLPAPLTALEARKNIFLNDEHRLFR